MKKLTVILLLTVGCFFQYCSTSKKTTVATTPEVKSISYISNVQELITAHCSPCHIPPNGNKEPLNSYATAKNNIDGIISRINLNPGDRGFMPFKHPKLSESEINIFVKWKADGLLDK